jgi:hypothetical protein
LSPFWANLPAAWFNTAEAHFTLRGITDPVEKYLIVHALSSLVGWHVTACPAASLQIGVCNSAPQSGPR